MISFSSAQNALKKTIVTAKDSAQRRYRSPCRQKERIATNRGIRLSIHNSKEDYDFTALSNMTSANQSVTARNGNLKQAISQIPLTQRSNHMRASTTAFVKKRASKNESSMQARFKDDTLSEVRKEFDSIAFLCRSPDEKSQPSIHKEPNKHILHGRHLPNNSSQIYMQKIGNIQKNRAFSGVTSPKAVYITSGSQNGRVNTAAIASEHARQHLIRTRVMSDN